MLIGEFIRAFEQTLPPTLAMPEDPVGIQVMPEDGELTGVLVAYEIDVDSVRAAFDAGANLIVAYHPLIYPSVASILPDGRVGRTIIALIESRVTVLVVHTAFDAHPRGTSRLLAEALSLGAIRPLVPDAVHPEAGMGAIGEFDVAVSLGQLAARVRDVCGASLVRTSSRATDGAMVRRVAVLGGSGMSFYEHAVAAGADAFVTADVRYHSFHDANDRIPVLDPGHAESERFVPGGIASLVSETLGTLGVAVPIRALPVATNPVRYFVN